MPLQLSWLGPLAFVMQSASKKRPAGAKVRPAGISWSLGTGQHTTGKKGVGARGEADETPAESGPRLAQAGNPTGLQEEVTALAAELGVGQNPHGRTEAPKEGSAAASSPPGLAAPAGPATRPEQNPTTKGSGDNNARDSPAGAVDALKERLAAVRARRPASRRGRKWLCRVLAERGLEATAELLVDAEEQEQRQKRHKRKRSRGA